MVRAVIVPGNGCNKVRSSNWYGWLERRLLQDGRFTEVVLRDMPDPLEAKRSIWLPFMLATLGCDTRTVVIGHSSGAVAAMRLLEQHELAGVLLVSVASALTAQHSHPTAYRQRPPISHSLCVDRAVSPGVPH